MDYKSILYAQTVAETGSFVRAAEKVSLTQSAISRSIIALEKELGITLFHRRIAGVTLTPAGEAFMRRARTIIDEMQALKVEVTGYQAEVAGDVVIGVSPSLAVSHLPRLLATGIKKYPKLRMSTAIDIWSNLCEPLRRGDVDFIIDSRGAIAGGDDFSVAVIGQYRGMGVFCRSGHPLSRKRRVVPEALLAYPVVTGGLDKTLTRIYRKFLNFDGDTALHVPLVCDNLLVLQQVVINSDALMLTSPDAMTAQVDAGLIVEVAVDFPTPVQPNDLLIVTPKGRAPSIAAQSLIEQFQALYGQSSGDRAAWDLQECGHKKARQNVPGN